MTFLNLKKTMYVSLAESSRAVLMVGPGETEIYSSLASKKEEEEEEEEEEMVPVSSDIRIAFYSKSQETPHNSQDQRPTIQGPINLRLTQQSQIGHRRSPFNPRILHSFRHSFASIGRSKVTCSSSQTCNERGKEGS
ncbi:hypothetical protein WAI453_005965 [Rhynchosporium graminicola]